MATITKQKDKVIINTGKESYAISVECNVLPHPRNTDYVIISEKATEQQEQEGVILRWQDYGLSVSSRSEFVELLAKDYFTLRKTDATRFLDTVGDGTGTKDFTGNYSTSLTKAIYRPQNSKTAYINRLIVFIADNGSVDAGYYGNSITLSNGIAIKHEKQDGTLIRDITDGQPILRNAGYAKFGFQVSDISFGSGLNYIHAVLTFEKNGTPLTVAPDEQLAVYFNDNFTPLIAHTFRAGAYE